jgi:hypothetical protein
MQKIFLLAILYLLVLGGCKEPTSPNEYRNELVVCGFLIANENVPDITVRRTARIDEFYTPEAVAITNALVIVAGNGLVDTLEHSRGIPGTYYSTHSTIGPGRWAIKPATSYTLTVIAPGYPVVTGTTTVPDAIELTNRADIPRQLTYLDGSLRLEWNANNHYADFLFSVTSLDSPAVKIDRNNPHADTTRLPGRTKFQFGLYGMDHTIVPWFTFNYYGRNSIAISAIDSNYYDFIRQTIVEGTDIRDIRFSLQGGVGVFGSAAIDSIEITLVK